MSGGRLRPPPDVAAALAYVASMFMAGVDMQIVNVALPTLSRYFSAPLSEVQWTAIAYVLTLAILIPASGWIGDRAGLKQTFIFAVVLFTSASAACGTVHALGELIAARALQGAGGGMMTPSGMAMLFRAYPPVRRASVARTALLPILIGPASAPILGGAFTEYLSWRWVFLVNVPAGIVIALFAWRFLPHASPARTNRLDVLGMMLSSIGLSSLLYALSEGSTIGWGSPAVVLAGAAGVALLAGFASWSLKHSDPILRLRLLGDRLFRSTNIVFALSTGPFLGSLYLTPIFLQEIMHQTPLASGATTFLEAVGVGVGSQTVGRLYPQLGPRPLMTFGAVALAVYLCGFLLIGSTTSIWTVRALMLFGGIANSGVFLATQTAMFTTIRPADIGHASAIYNTQRQAAIALNIALLTTIAAGSADASISAFHSAYLAAAGIAMAGSVCALVLIRTRDAEATMHARRCAL